MVATAGCFAEISEPGRGEVADPAAPISSEVALYRVQDGDCLSMIADRLGYRGGWRRLMAESGKRSPELRAGEGLLVPLSGLVLSAGGELPEHLEPFEASLPSDQWAPCRTLAGRGTCVELGSVTVCKEDRNVTVYRDGYGGPVAELPDEPTGELAAYRADLDGDGDDEVIAAVELANYGHLGFSHYRVIVVGGPSGRGGVSQLSISEWSDRSIVEGVEGDRGTCELLASEWETGLQHPLDPPGTYLVAHRLAYRNGALIAHGDRTVRRMRDAFFVDSGGDVVSWLSDPRLASRWRDVGPTSDLRRGEIAAVEVVEGMVAITAQFPNGSTMRFAPHELDGRSQLIESLQWATGATMPEDFVPADLARWIGRPLWVSRPELQSDDGQLAAYRLWLDI